MRTPLFLAALTVAATLLSVDVSNLSDKAHISGPKLTAKDLEGKVIAVEEWGLRCPPCRASLPHMAKLAKDLAKDPRVVFIGAHFQGRNDEAIRALLKSNGCDYPVYQMFKVSGSPNPTGIPHAYVVNHRGQTVWNGYPNEDFRKAIEAAVKAVPKAVPGSLLGGMALEHNKDMARRFIVGTNVEGAMRQLQARLQRGGAAAEEAKEILAKCDACAEAMAKEVSEALENRPSQALAAGKRYLRTFPTRAAEFREALAKAAKDPLTARLAASRETLEKLRQTNAATANARKALLNKVNMQLRQLGTLTVDAANEDFADVKALWEAYAGELAE